MVDELRISIEHKFAGVARKLFFHPVKTLLFVVIVFAAFASNLPKITLDTSTEGFLHETDPHLVTYREFRERYGRDETLIVALKPEKVFDLGFLKKLKALHDELASKVPHVEDVNSLVTARSTRGVGDELIVEDLMEDFPKTPEEVARLKERVIANPIYQNFLVSEDGAFTTIVITSTSHAGGADVDDVLAAFDDATTAEPGEKGRPFLTDVENSAMVNAALDIVDTYRTPGLEIAVAGSPVVVHELKARMMHDMRRFMVMALLIIGVSLYVMFRRFSGVILPFVIIIMALLSTVGLMAATGTAIKLPTQILPSFILAVGVGSVVHILALFYYRLNHGDEKVEAIVYAMGHSGLPVVMASLTTAAGLGSFATAEVAPIADLGKFASFGVLMSLFYTIMGLPAMIALTPIKSHPGEGEKSGHVRFDRFLEAIADFATHNPFKIIATSAALIAVSLFFASSVIFSHDPLSWMPEEMAIRQATKLIDRELKGSVTLEVIVDTGKENGLYNPSIMKKLAALQDELEKIDEGKIFVGKTVSLATILKETNRALNENRPEAYVVPDSRELIAQELLLFENSGSDDLEDFTDSQFSQARFTIKAPWLDAITYGSFIQRIESRFREVFKGEATIEATGLLSLLGRTLSAAIRSAAKSYVIAGFVITFMMILLIGRVKTGLLSMIPNLTPIILALGVMGLFDWPLDMFTMLIGSIAIGLAVDDTIHFMHNFHRYFHLSGDPYDATRQTLKTTGRAMLVTTIVLSLGFFIFLFSDMANLYRFGFLVGFSVLMALVADFLLAPAIMTLVAKKRADRV